MDNMNLVNAYITTAQKVSHALKEKYGDQWTEPAAGVEGAYTLAQIEKSEDI